MKVLFFLRINNYPPPPKNNKKEPHYNVFVCDGDYRNISHHCQTSFTTTLDLKRSDVIYGSKVGNTTNPQFLEADSWVIS